MFVIGVDPHKGSHTAAVLNATEEVIAECRVDADRKQLARLLDRGRSDKTDAHDARVAAVVALRHANLRTVTCEDHDAVLRRRICWPGQTGGR